MAVLAAEPAEVPAEPEKREDVSHLRVVEVGRREGERACEDARGALHRRVELGPAGRVLRGEGRHRGRGARRVAVEAERAAVGERGEEPRLRLEEGEPVAGE